MGDLTTWLAGVRQGDSEAFSRLFSELYPDLRHLAHARLRRHGTPTLLDTTSLVHESYLRFLRARRVHVVDRAHFMAYAARVMRSVVVDFVREHSAQRRGGQDLQVTLHVDAVASLGENGFDVIRINEALNELATLSERLVRVVEMRYFAGMSDAEIAEVLGLTERTVRRDWEKARMILAATLR